MKFCNIKNLNNFIKFKQNMNFVINFCIEIDYSECLKRLCQLIKPHTVLFYVVPLSL